MVLSNVMDGKEEKKDNIWERIIKIAQSDGHITPEESKLIRIILENVQNYEMVLDKALEDNKIDQDERKELINKRANILDRAYREASDDDKITDDEYAIIEETLKILRALEIEEENFVI